jgi:glutamyl-Q tRNA(Asp) synthetase
VVLAADGKKLSKQNGAAAFDTNHPLAALREAAGVLGLQPEGNTLSNWLDSAVAGWAAKLR